MTPTKGGMTGLPEDDFNRRQKSGDWSIDEHFRDVNYIRTKDSIPNEYLTAGHYENENLTIYNPFLNRFSSLTMSASGNDPSVTCMAYNRHIGHLAVCLVVISMDALSVVVLQDCPLSLLEERYLNTSSTRERKDFMCSLGVGYNCDHQYEKIIELLINVWSICALKMFVIILLRSFNTTIIDYNHIYSS